MTAPAVAMVSPRLERTGVLSLIQMPLHLDPGRTLYGHAQLLPAASTGRAGCCTLAGIPSAGQAFPPAANRGSSYGGTVLRRHGGIPPERSSVPPPAKTPPT